MLISPGLGKQKFNEDGSMNGKDFAAEQAQEPIASGKAYLPLPFKNLGVLSKECWICEPAFIQELPLNDDLTLNQSAKNHLLNVPLIWQW